MTKQEFLKMYETMTIAEICKKLDCSQSTIYRTLKRHGLPLKQGRIEIERRKKKINFEMDKEVK